MRYLRGAIDEPGLLALAVGDDQQTEARCFLGLDHLLKGRKDEAIRHLGWVVEKGNRASPQYTIAVAEMRRLGGPAAAAKGAGSK